MPREIFWPMSLMVKEAGKEPMKLAVYKEEKSVRY